MRVPGEVVVKDAIVLGTVEAEKIKARDIIVLKGNVKAKEIQICGGWVKGSIKAKTIRSSLLNVLGPIEATKIQARCIICGMYITVNSLKAVSVNTFDILCESLECKGCDAWNIYCNRLRLLHDYRNFRFWANLYIKHSSIDCWVLLGEFRKIFDFSDYCGHPWVNWKRDGSIEICGYETKGIEFKGKNFITRDEIIRNRPTYPSVFSIARFYTSVISRLMTWCEKDTSYMDILLDLMDYCDTQRLQSILSDN